MQPEHIDRIEKLNHFSLPEFYYKELKDKGGGPNKPDEGRLTGRIPDNSKYRRYKTYC